MAAGNQNQGHRNAGNSRDQVSGGNPSQSPGRPRAEDQEGGDALGDQIRERIGDAGEYAKEGLRHAGSMVSQNPSSSVMIGFGLGMGIGLAITALLTKREETWSERYVPDSLRKARMPELIKEMPDSLHATFHHLSESIRDLPSVLSKMMHSR